MLKTKICEKLEKGDISGVEEMIGEYEKKYPDDFDLFSMKGTYCFFQGDYERAEDIFKKAHSINPYNCDINYNLGFLYESTDRYFEAAEKYLFLASVANLGVKGLEDNRKFLPELKKSFENMIAKINELEQTEEIKNRILKFNREMDDNFGAYSVHPWALNKKNYLGDFLRYNADYFVGDYFRIGNRSVEDPRKVEVVKLFSKNSNKISVKTPTLVPIITAGRELIIRSGKTYQCLQDPSVFHWYRFDRDAEIRSGAIIGEPVPLVYNKTKKKLILTIFTDGLSQSMLEKYGFEEYMPNTARFFSNALYFKNCYSTGEWTYPSMASYFTGLYTTQHKLFSTVNWFLPTDTKTLGEIFSDAGYLCSKIDGDWRTNPDYGYIRGFYRYVYGKYTRFSDASDIIAETKENLELFKGTNQYMMITFDELHDIADGYKLPCSVHSKLSLDDLERTDASMTTSVLTARDAKKEAKYMEQMRFLDRKLKELYDYLNENYAEDEIIVSLISDHGQGYLVEDDDFFLDDKRTKVPLLIKGISKSGVCEEYISAVDYLNILNKEANLGADLSDKEGVLPVFLGGEKKRDFTVSESLHPDRPYRVALRNEEDYFTFETQDVAMVDGRIPLDRYTAKLMNHSKEEIKDEEKFKKYLQFVFEHMKHFRIWRDE